MNSSFEHSLLNFFLSLLMGSLLSSLIVNLLQCTVKYSEHKMVKLKKNPIFRMKIGIETVKTFSAEEPPGNQRLFINLKEARQKRKRETHFLLVTEDTRKDAEDFKQ